MLHLTNPFYYQACCHTAMGGNQRSCWVCKTNLPYKDNAANLRHGDVVRAYDGPGYSASTVIDIDREKETVRLFRPYVHTSDVVTTAGLIPYIGHEDYPISFQSDVIVLMETRIPEVLAAETDVARLLRAGSSGEARLRQLRDLEVLALKASL